MTQPLILIDAYNLVFRSHYAFLGLTNKAGFPTGAMYGFLRSLLDLKKVSPRIAVLWDHGTPGSSLPSASWRKRLDPTYKANRQKTDDTANALDQTVLIHNQLENMGYCSYGVLGFEADDLIGLICSQTEHEIFIYSTDEDLYQLLESTRVKVMRPKKEKQKHIVFTASQIEKEYEVPITRWPDYLALGADSSDNIKAVRGWGPKKASKLVQAGVDLRLPLDKQPAQLRKELAPHWERIRMAYMMTAIPRTPNDTRIAKLLPTEMNGMFDLSSYQPTPAGKHYVQALNIFMKFCMKYDLADFMEHRYEFLNQ